MMRPDGHHSVGVKRWWSIREDHYKVLAVIPARGGSVGPPGKISVLSPECLSLAILFCLQNSVYN